MDASASTASRFWSICFMLFRMRCNLKQRLISGRYPSFRLLAHYLNGMSRDSRWPVIDRRPPRPLGSVLHILSHCTSYSFYFIICSLFHSHLYLYIYYLVLCFIVLLLMLFLFYFLFYYYYNFFFFALSIERTCPDLHFTTDYTLYDCVCDEY